MCRLSSPMCVDLNLSDDHCQLRTTSMMISVECCFSFFFFFLPILSIYLLWIFMKFRNIRYLALFQVELLTNS